MFGRSSLIRIIYFSRSRLAKADDQRAEQIAKLIRASKRQNEFSLVGSVLVYDRGWFLQVLEGVRDDLAKTFQRVSSDTRHDELRIVEWREIPRRDLISSLDYHERDAESQALFTRYSFEETLRRGTPKPGFLLAFLLALHKLRAAKANIDLMV